MSGNKADSDIVQARQEEKTRCVASMVEASLPGIKVLLSHTGDSFVPLRERTSFANRERADLFVSIHANTHRKHPRPATSPAVSRLCG